MMLNVALALKEIDYEVEVIFCGITSFKLQSICNFLGWRTMSAVITRLKTSRKNMLI